MAAKWPLYFGRGGLDFSKSIWWARAVSGAEGGRKESRIWGLVGGMIIWLFGWLVVILVVPDGGAEAEMRGGVKTGRAGS